MTIMSLLPMDLDGGLYIRRQLAPYWRQTKRNIHNDCCLVVRGLRPLRPARSNAHLAVGVGETCFLWVLVEG